MLTLPLVVFFFKGGYYLTSAYGAMSLIKNFQEEKAAKVLSSEARDTLHQWHRRRTLTQRSAPCIDDFQVKRHWRQLHSKNTSFSSENLLRSCWFFQEVDHYIISC